MKHSIVGSVDGLCVSAIAAKLMTPPEKAGIMMDNDTHKQASRFLDSLAPKIEVEPIILALLMNILTDLGSMACDKVVSRISKSKWFLLLDDRGLDKVIFSVIEALCIRLLLSFLVVV